MKKVVTERVAFRITKVQRQHIAELASERFYGNKSLTARRALDLGLAKLREDAPQVEASQ